MKFGPIHPTWLILGTTTIGTASTTRMYVGQNLNVMELLVLEMWFEMSFLTGFTGIGTPLLFTV